MSEPQVYEYEGPVYIRPVSRGVRLGTVADCVYLDDIIDRLLAAQLDPRQDTFPRLRLRIEVTAEVLEP